MLDQAGLLLLDNGLLVSGLVLRAAGMAMAVILVKEGLAADELAPETNQDGANDHTDTRKVNQ